LSVLNVWGKLTFTYSLDVWIFRTSVTPFFVHWLAALALPATATHYTMTLWRNLCKRPKQGTRREGLPLFLDAPHQEVQDIMSIQTTVSEHENMAQAANWGGVLSNDALRLRPHRLRVHARQSADADRV
jgi:hypothetical protein